MTFNRKEYMKEWTAANPEKVKEANKKWRATNPEYHREYHRRYRAANPEKAREYDRRYRAANLEKVKENKRRWAAANPEKIKESSRKWRATNPEANRKWLREHPEYNKQWKAANPQKVRASQRKWKALNPEKVRESNIKDLKTFRKKNRDDPIYKLHNSMRSAMSNALSRHKSLSTMTIIGCTVEGLFEHLESCASWEPWMTRENYGAGGWDVDHIIAISKWDRDCPLQFVLCWDKSNLQPMEHIANIKKGAR
jgi:hypothetical protein